MSLKTRLDGRSEDNSSFKIKDAQGNEIAQIKLLDSAGATLEITTQDGLLISKPNGWNSTPK